MRAGSEMPPGVTRLPLMIACTMTIVSVVFDRRRLSR